jgi:glycosyltransferase involved in cell wall biosynthesis
MRIASLNELPSPPPDKTGWPWTEQSPVLPERMPDGSEWPKISIVTPSFNQGQFIEETIRSVLLQNYPNLEYIIMDGGSTDESVEIIKKYAPWLTYWVSEKDEGQSDAINKGFSMANGDILAWLNSDDFFVEQTFKNVSLNLGLDAPNWLIGECYFFNADSNRRTLVAPANIITPESLLQWYAGNGFSQPSTFWNRMIFEKSGALDKSLSYVMDIDLWYRLSKISVPIVINKVLSSYRIHDLAKTFAQSQCSDNELFFWISKILIKEKNYDLLSNILRKHKSSNAMLNRLTSHLVIGNFILLWKNFINKNILS